MRGFPRMALIILLIIASLTIVLSSMINRNDEEGKMAGNTATAAAMPAIDAITPVKTETATFALG